MYVKSNLTSIVPTKSLVQNSYNTRFSENLTLSQNNFENTIQTSFEFSL